MLSSSCSSIICCQHIHVAQATSAVDSAGSTAVLFYPIEVPNTPDIPHLRVDPGRWGMLWSCDCALAFLCRVFTGSILPPQAFRTCMILQRDLQLLRSMTIA